MKILSRMLSKKEEAENAGAFAQDEEHAALDDAGQVRRSPRADDDDLPLEAGPEEPEVAGSGWAQSDDWEEDWDDDEEWGEEDDPEFNVSEHRAKQDKQLLVSEIRDAMVSVSRVKAEEPKAHRADPADGAWADDEDFGRRARARSQLTSAAADESEDRILEKTENVMSDQETSRRRSAMAHMKAAAAATKADRVLRHVASRDPSADPAEQSPYRDDLAKVVRPQSTSRPISRQVNRADTQQPVWDQGTNDEDAALFAASEDGLTEPAESGVHKEMDDAESQRLARAPADLSAEDFAADEPDEGGTRNITRSAFPSSRFAEDEFDDEEEELDRNAFESHDEDPAPVTFDEDDNFADDEVDDSAPRPSSAVAEAVAFANATDDEPEEQPESVVRKKIWEMADEVAVQVENSRLSALSEPEPEPDFPSEPEETPVAEEASENFADLSTAVPGRAGRTAGRVKTRLLGFQGDDQQDVFAAPSEQVPTSVERFPTGWIVVIDGPGRGASFALHSGVSQIGRGDDQTVRLDFGDTSISRNNHAAVAYDEEQAKFFLGHGGKSNLVRLNAKPVLSTEELTDGDEIRIGETSLKFVALCGEEFTWSEEGAGAPNA